MLNDVELEVAVWVPNTSTNWLEMHAPVHPSVPWAHVGLACLVLVRVEAVEVGVLLQPLALLHGNRARQADDNPALQLVHSLALQVDRGPAFGVPGNPAQQGGNGSELQVGSDLALRVGHNLGSWVGHNLASGVGHNLASGVGHSLGQGVGHSLALQVDHSLALRVDHNLALRVGHKLAQHFFVDIGSHCVACTLEVNWQWVASILAKPSPAPGMAVRLEPLSIELPARFVAQSGAARPVALVSLLVVSPVVIPVALLVTRLTSVRILIPFHRHLGSQAS